MDAIGHYLLKHLSLKHLSKYLSRLCCVKSKETYLKSSKSDGRRLKLSDVTGHYLFSYLSPKFLIFLQIFRGMSKVSKTYLKGTHFDSFRIIRCQKKYTIWQLEYYWMSLWPLFDQTILTQFLRVLLLEYNIDTKYWGQNIQPSSWEDKNKFWFFLENKIELDFKTEPRCKVLLRTKYLTIIVSR